MTLCVIIRARFGRFLGDVRRVASALECHGVECGDVGLVFFSEFDNCVFVFVLLNMYILQRIWNA